MSIPKLILITPDYPDDKQIAALQEAIKYVDKLHIKLKANENALLNYLEKIIAFTSEKNRSKLVLHLNEHLLEIYSTNEKYYLSHLFSVLEKKVDFLHQNFHISHFHFSETLYTQCAYTIPDKIFHTYTISASLHTLNLTEQHNTLHYILYGPVFPSISKKNYLPTLNLRTIQKQLKYLSKNIAVPVIAVGGITEYNFNTAIQMGFDGIALRGYIWESSDPLSSLKRFIEKWTIYHHQ